MFLTKEEESILAGEQGHGRRRAMELLVAVGKIYGAEKLVPITSAHLSGVSYKTIGEGGIDFLKEMSQDCKVIGQDHPEPIRHGQRKMEGDAHQGGIRRRSSWRSWIITEGWA